MVFRWETHFESYLYVWSNLAFRSSYCKASSEFECTTCYSIGIKLYVWRRLIIWWVKRQISPCVVIQKPRKRQYWQWSRNLEESKLVSFSFINSPKCYNFLVSCRTSSLMTLSTQKTWVFFCIATSRSLLLSSSWHYLQWQLLYPGKYIGSPNKYIKIFA